MKKSTVGFLLLVTLPFVVIGCLWVIIASYLFSGWGDGATVRNLSAIPIATAIMLGHISVVFYLIRKEKKPDKTDEELLEVYNHPKYKKFLESNPENQFIYKEQTKDLFERWLNENES